MRVDFTPNRFKEFLLIQFFRAFGGGNTVEVTEAPDPAQLPSVALGLLSGFLPDQMTGLQRVEIGDVKRNGLPSQLGIVLPAADFEHGFGALSRHFTAAMQALHQI